MFVCILYVTGNAACFIGSRSKNLTDQEDKREGLETEGLEGMGSKRNRFERERL